jgi:hypothetical protein
MAREMLSCAVVVENDRLDSVEFGDGDVAAGRARVPPFADYSIAVPARPVQAIELSGHGDSPLTLLLAKISEH